MWLTAVPTETILGAPIGLALDAAEGHIYFADYTGHRVYKVEEGASPTIATIAGTGTPGFSGDGGAGSSGQVSGPFGLARDTDDHIYITDRNNDRIRKIE